MIVLSNAFLKSVINFFKKYFFSEHMMMKSFSLEEESIIKDARNLFRLKKELNYTAVKDMRNLFRIEKKLNQLKIEHLEILRIFLSMKKKKKIIINQ